MRILAKVTPSTKITARLSNNSNVRRYTSLVQVRNKQWKNNCHSKLQSRTFYEADQYKVGTKTFNKSNELEQSGGLQSTILPIALIDLNPLSSKSSKVLLIPLNWNDSDEYAVRNTVTSIFSKSKNLKQIEAFSQALKSVPSYKNVENKPAAADHANEKKDLLPVAKVKNFSNSMELEQKNVDIMEVGNLNMNLDNLARAVDKTLQQCCLHCMQISSDNQIIGEKIKLFTAPIQTAQLTAAENIKLTSLFKINGSDINLGDFTWQRKIPFPELQSTSLTNITFPTALKKKSFSAKTIPLMQPKLLCAPSDSLQKCTDSTAIKPNARSASSNVPSSKGVNKCNFTFLSNLFGTDNLLMSCDAYNKALIEASKRKAALAESLMQGKQSEMNNFKRPKVINIKGCTALEQNLSTNSQSATNASKPCPPPAKPTKIAKGGGCKKDDPCKPTTCPDPCKEEMEKLQRLKEEEMNRKRKKVPTGCVSPKCKKEDGCTKLKKGPSKKASGRINKNCSKMQMKGNLKRLRSSNRLRKSLQCTQKGKNTSCGKGKGKKQENPCADEHKEYKPKCNADPCKKQEPPCGGSTKKKADSGGCKKDDPCKKKEDPCKKKEDPCKKKSPCGSKKEDPCKRKDPCGSKKEDPCKKKSPCGSKKEDPCKKKDPCGSKKEDPCKKKDPCGSKKDDPCKKKDPCGSKKEDPCKKKDPCGSKKEDPCKKKPSSPCKSKKPKGSSTNCGKQKGPTKPNCKKSYSTLCLVENHIAGSPIKRAYSSLTALLPQIKNKHFFSNGFMRRFSSKKDGKNSKKDYGKSSQCKIDATKVPPKRKPAYNPHAKDGIRQCFPTYDMDCKKLCKDPRKTSCKKFAFLKDTDNNKRDENRLLVIQNFGHQLLKKNSKIPYFKFQCKHFHASFSNSSNFFNKNILLPYYKTDKDSNCIKRAAQLNNKKLIYEDYVQELHEKTNLKNEIIQIETAGVTDKLVTEIPSISDYDILLRTTKIAISDSDIYCFENGINSGITLGHDAAGIVVDVGQNIKKFKPGDRVVVESGISCGICNFCKTGAYNMCSQLRYNGFFRKYQAHPADLCFKLPDTLSITEGSLIQTLALGCQAVFVNRITPASNILIMGSSSTAVASALCAHAIGAKQIALICTTYPALESIRKTFGFNYIHYNEKSDPAEQLESIFQLYNDWPDVVINCAVNDHTMSLAVTALKPSGCCVLTECDIEYVKFNAFDAVMKNIRLISSFRSNNMFPIAINLMSSGRAPIGKIISTIFSWDSIDEAFRLAQNASNCGYQKVIVHCGDDKTLTNRL